MSPSSRVSVLTYRARQPSEEDVARWATKYTSEQYRWNVGFAVSTPSASVAWHQQTTAIRNRGGGFDLYRAQFESYLAQRDCCGILAGTDTRDGSNAAAQAIWDERNGFARDSLLRGLLAKDAKRVCKMLNGHDMWVAFEKDKTKRAFASVIRLRKELYTTIFRVSGDMDKYLEKLEDLHRQLASMNAIITDGEMANIILQGVETTHRSVVRLFNSPNMMGAGKLEPDLDVVLNTLRGEAERD
ncbi:hypothetical protein PF007_g18397 [Phytophthora fragariae]|uniref:Uncharacterized protein n=2 Tax=Phytophthora fragariae TaxID=53985 RepID=A0A6A3RAM4_9STRA|nr:hypothetical protein PF011_g11224 [Phytophthora fragariae]KAE9092676.1 hypothetical protein PF007_g18397 [Phytophthora fragariae]KAE9140602.1 hypothetical protein PF006_g13490 [Phytophthora fragariae]